MKNIKDESRNLDTSFRFVKVGSLKSASWAPDFLRHLAREAWLWNLLECGVVTWSAFEVMTGHRSKRIEESLRCCKSKAEVLP